MWFLRYEVRQTKKFCNFAPIFTLLPPPPLMILNIKTLKKMKKMPGDIIILYIYVYHKWKSYDIWFLKYKVWQKEILNILGYICPFSPLTTWKIKILTLKKTPGDINILHICTINDNHMIYGSWDMAYNRKNFLSFWTIFCPFTLLWTQKTKIFKKIGKNTGRHYHFTNIKEILSFYTCVP